MNLLLALFLLLEAVFEGLKTRGQSTTDQKKKKRLYLASEIIETFFWIIVYSMCFGWIERDGLLWDYPLVYPFWKCLVGYLLLRLALFDIIWNISAGQKWNFYGTTKLYDRIMTELGSWGWMMKAIGLIVGMCFLLGID